MNRPEESAAVPRLQAPGVDGRGRKPGPLPKGVCVGCHVRRSLRSDGTLFSHWINMGFDPMVGYTRYSKCEGSHQKPTDAEVTA